MDLESWCGVTLLGEFRVLAGRRGDDEGGRVSVTPSAERLLAVLAVAHRSRRVRRSVVAARLWPDAAEGRGTASLRSTMWRLPRVRGRALVQGDATMVWLADGVEVDLWHSDDLAHRLGGSETTAVHADDLSLLHDDLLPGWGEDWLTLEQESHRQRRLRALESAAGVLCRAGRHDEALDAALAAVAAEPLRESAHRRVVDVHLAEGNHAEALRQYDGYRRLLAEELGLRPSDTIRRLVAPLLGRPLDGTDARRPHHPRVPRTHLRASEWPHP